MKRDVVTVLLWSMGWRSAYIPDSSGWDEYFPYPFYSNNKTLPLLWGLREELFDRRPTFSSSSLMEVLQLWTQIPGKSVGTSSEKGSLGLVLQECTTCTNSPFISTEAALYADFHKAQRSGWCTECIPFKSCLWLVLVKIGGAVKKLSSRRPFLSVCFHPCLGNTMNADVGNFWLSIGFFCGNFKALRSVIFWGFKWICSVFRNLI